MQGDRVSASEGGSHDAYALVGGGPGMDDAEIKPQRTGRGGWSAKFSHMWEDFVELCHLRVSADTLCVLRIGFGLILVMQHSLWSDMPVGTRLS